MYYDVDNLGDCETCHQPLELHYTPWCPRCDKPEPETITVYNLSKMMRYTELKDRNGQFQFDLDMFKGHSRCFWLWLCDSDFLSVSDGIVQFWPLDDLVTHASNGYRGPEHITDEEDPELKGLDFGVIMLLDFDLLFKDHFYVRLDY